MNKLLLPFLLLLLAGCSSDPTDSNNTESDMDLGADDASMNDQGIAEDASMDEGQADMEMDESLPDADDDAAPDDAGPDLDLPFRGQLTMEGDFQRKATFPVEVAEEGILVVELYNASVELDDISFKVCGSEPNSCIGSSFPTPSRDYMPLRSLRDLSPGNYTLEFSISSFVEPEGPQTLEIGVSWLTYQVIDAPPDSYVDAQELDLPGAYQVSVTEGTPAWFELNIGRPGYVSILRTNNNVYLCDMASWEVNPEGCRYGARETQGENEAGLTYLLAESSFTTTRSFVVFHDEDPNAQVCPNDQHPLGDGTCGAEGTCAPAYHDGGWGRCVPDGTCSPNFELRADGRCEGWVASGQLESFEGINDRVISGPDDTIIISGLQRDANGDRVHAPQVWDPTTRTWSVADPSASPVGIRRICALADGRLLTMRYGGFVTTAPSDSEQIFDPSTGLWSVPLNTPGIVWARPSCVLLNDGRTLVFEGAKAQLFDPIAETWTATGVIPGGSDYDAAEVAPGLVFAAGNDAVQAITRHLWRWDASTNLWTQTPEWMLSDELDGDQYMVGVGGDPILFLPDGRVVRFDVSENTWSLLNAIEVPGFNVFVNGAVSRGDEVLFTYTAQSFGVGVYDVSTEQWRALPEPVLSGVAMISGDDYLLVSKSPQRLVVGQ